MRTQPYLPPATRAVKGNHRSGWGLAQLHGNQRWSVPLDVPRCLLPAAPNGCDGSPRSSRLHARPMAGQKYHCPTLRIIALPGAARQLQKLLLAPSPMGRSSRDFWIGFGSSPRSGNVLDEVRIRLSRFREGLSGGEILRKSPSIYKPREKEMFPSVFKIFQKIVSAAYKSCRAVWIWPPVAPPPS